MQLAEKAITICFGVFGGEITVRYSWMPRPNKVSGLYLMVLLLEDTAVRSGYCFSLLYLAVFLQSDTATCHCPETE